MASSRWHEKLPDRRGGTGKLGGMPPRMGAWQPEKAALQCVYNESLSPIPRTTMSRVLLIQCPDGQMKTVALTGERLSIGRSSAAELCFPEDAGLSRQHFAFEADGDDWTVQDLGSKNGTFVNNIPLKARLILKPGDRVTAGHLEIVYAPDAADPNAGVVVFEGETTSPTTSTVVTSLEGALSNQTMAFDRGGGPRTSAPMQALIRAGQE